MQMFFLFLNDNMCVRSREFLKLIKKKSSLDKVHCISFTQEIANMDKSYTCRYERCKATKWYNPEEDFYEMLGAKEIRDVKGYNICLARIFISLYMGSFIISIFFFFLFLLTLIETDDYMKTPYKCKKSYSKL